MEDSKTAHAVSHGDCVARPVFLLHLHRRARKHSQKRHVSIPTNRIRKFTVLSRHFRESPTPLKPGTLGKRRPPILGHHEDDAALEAVSNAAQVFRIDDEGLITAIAAQPEYKDWNCIPPTAELSIVDAVPKFCPCPSHVLTAAAAIARAVSDVHSVGGHQQFSFFPRRPVLVTQFLNLPAAAAVGHGAGLLD